MTRTDRAGRPIRDYSLRKGQPPGNKGKRYPPSPPSRPEILRALARLGETPQDLRLAALIVLLWRGGLTIGEALDVRPIDLKLFDADGWLRVRRGRFSRVVTLDELAVEWLDLWVAQRAKLPAGALLCVLRGPTAGQAWSGAGARTELARLGVQADVAQLRPKELRHAWVAERLADGATPAEVREELAADRWVNLRAYRHGLQASEQEDE